MTQGVKQTALDGLKQSPTCFQSPRVSSIRLLCLVKQSHYLAQAHPELFLPQAQTCPTRVRYAEHLPRVCKSLELVPSTPRTEEGDADMVIMPVTREAKARGQAWAKTRPRLSMNIYCMPGALPGQVFSLYNPLTAKLPRLPRGDDSIVRTPNQHQTAHAEEVLPPRCGDAERWGQSQGANQGRSGRGTEVGAGPYQWHWDGLFPR